MTVCFQPVLKLEIWHDYWLAPPADLTTLPTPWVSPSAHLSSLPSSYNISQTLALRPTRECQAVLRQLRWFIRPQAYGAILLAQVDVEEDHRAADKAIALTPFVPIERTTRLTFWLEVRDRNFANYTDLSLLTPRDRIYYFSNRFGQPTDEQLSLTASQYVSAEDTLPRQGPSLTHTVPQVKTGRDSFVYFDPMAGRNAFALVEITLNRLLNEQGEIPPPQPKTYRIHFKNRATRWRYHCDRPHGFSNDSGPVPFVGMPPQKMSVPVNVIDRQTYATQDPIGLSYYRQPNQPFTDPKGKRLAAPSSAMIVPQTQLTDDGTQTVTAIYSDIYL